MLANFNESKHNNDDEDDDEDEDEDDDDDDDDDDDGLPTVACMHDFPRMRSADGHARTGNRFMHRKI